MSCRIAMLLIVLAAGCSQQAGDNSASSSEDSINFGSEGNNQNQSPGPEFETVAYENREFGYTIYLPKEWEEIAADNLAERSKAASSSGANVEYIAGYQVVRSGGYATADILVRRLPERAMPKSKLESFRDLILSSGNEINEKLSGGSEAVAKVEMGVPILEETTGIVWVRYSLEGIDGMQIEGLTAHYYVDGYILQFISGTAAKFLDEEGPALEHILRTISTH